LELLAEKDQTDLTLQFITETTQMLSDPTRLKAIYLLQQESMYLKQLADALDISSATMSHHIQNLINSELVSMDVQGKNRRIYYKLNQQTFEKLADEIKKIAEVSKSLT
jgi:DNA-binding transcriptional ArsR family regulator